MRNICLLISAGLIFFFNAVAQTGFNIFIEPYEIPSLPGLHSFAAAKHDGKWLILSGRKDGMHIPQPGAFPAASRNTTIYVVDPQSKQIWSAPVSSLPDTLADQLSSTNTNFFHDEDYLYVTGGYGFSSRENSKITFPYLTSIRIDSLMEAIITGQSIAPWFHQIRDDYFAVTGGRLNKLHDTFYLVCGHRFDGEVNLIPTTFTQAYTYSIRKFTIDEPQQLNITKLQSLTDSAQLRRRDYNLVKQIFQGGTAGLTIFTGVFPNDIAALPYTNTIDIDTTSYFVNNNFQQRLNHYQCGVIPVYDSIENKMHTVFFGGVSQFTVDANGIFHQDDNFPFVKTIARVTRHGDGTMTEVKMPAELPELLGSGAEFIFADNLPLLEHEILSLTELQNDTTFAGYLVGGISSRLPYAFINDPDTNSHANPTIYKVYVVKGHDVGGREIHLDELEALNLKISPNPAHDFLIAEFFIAKKTKALIEIFDVTGKILYREETGWLNKGVHSRTLRLPDVLGVVLVRISAGKFSAVKKVELK